MKMKATYLLFFALLVMNTTYGAAQNSLGFDHFWLVQVWPHGYCMDHNCSRSSDIFILHGLWPVTFSGETLISENKSDPDKILKPLAKDRSLRKDLMKYWLSLTTKNKYYMENFWVYEWDKHGSVQNRIKSPLVYFRRAVELTKNLNLLKTLEDKGLLANGDSYPRSKYKKAIMDKTGHIPILGCVKKDRQFQLKEVTLCVDPEARNFRAYNYRIKDKCGKDNIKFPAP